MENINEVDILPETEKKEKLQDGNTGTSASGAASLGSSFGKGYSMATDWIAKVAVGSVPYVVDAAEELARGLTKSVPKTATFILDTVVNGLDIAGDVGAAGIDLAHGFYAGVENENRRRRAEKDPSYVYKPYTFESYSNKEGFLDRFNAASDEFTTKADAAVDEFFDRPEFNQFHSLDDTMMKEVIGFVGESVGYFYGGKWVTLPAKLVFTGRNAAQTKTAMKVIVANKQLKASGAFVKGTKEAKQLSEIGKKAKTTLKGLLSSNKIKLVDPTKGFVAGNVKATSMSANKYVQNLVDLYDKGFAKVSGVALHPLKNKKVIAGGLAAGFVASEYEKGKQKGDASTTEVEEKGFLDIAKDKIGEWKEGALQLWEDLTDKDKEYITEKNELGMSDIATEKFSSVKGQSLDANIELDWRLDGEETVFYNWQNGYIWSSKDGNLIQLDSEIFTIDDANLAESNMQDYMSIYYE